MKRPVVLIVGAAAGAVLVAAVGASAHTGLSLTRLIGVHSAISGEEATGARTETPEPAETPEAPAAAAPAEAPDTDTETNDQNEAPKATTTTEHDDGEGGGEHGTSGGGDQGD